MAQFEDTMTWNGMVVDGTVGMAWTFGGLSPVFSRSASGGTATMGCEWLSLWTASQYY
jgi:hypothetical protein